MILKNQPILDTQVAIKMYLDGMTVCAIARHFRVRTHTIATLLKANEVRIRGPKKYLDIVTNFFEIIDTEEKAYWLGFLYADGYVNKLGSAIEVGLAIVDKQHLELFRDTVAPSVPIVERTTQAGNDKDYPSCRLSVCGAEFVKHLTNKGCLNNKSLTLTFPSEQLVPLRLQNHFIRGYFDGDGSAIESTKDTIAVDFIGTAQILDGIQTVFVECIPGYKWIGISPSAGARSFHFRKTGVYNSDDISRFLYMDATVYLARKFNKFQKLCRVRQ